MSNKTLSRPKKRSFSIKGHRTSLSLEEPFWQALRDVAEARDLSLVSLVNEIDQSRGDVGLSSAVRAYLLNYYRAENAERT